MCRNHSHITTELTGLLLVGETHLHELRVIQPLAVETPYGETWTRPAGSTLYLPVSMCVPLPALHRRLTEVFYIPSFFTGSSVMITTPDHPTTPMPAGDNGPMNYAGGGRSPQTETTYDEFSPRHG